MKSRHSAMLFVIITILLFASLLLFLNLTDPSDFEATATETVRQADITMISCDMPSYILNHIETDVQEKVSSDIHFMCTNYPDHIYYNTLNATLHSEIGPDLIMIEHPVVLDTLVPTSELLPLNIYIDDTWRTQLNVYTTANSLYYSPPLGVRTYKIYYNKSVMNQLGYDINTMSFSDLLLLLHRLKERGFIPIAFGTRDWKCIKNILIQLNTNPDADDPWETSSNRLKSLKPYLMPKPQLYDYEDAKLSFKQEETLMFFGMDTEMNELAGDCAFDIGEFHLSDDDSITIWRDYVGMYAINKNIPNKKEALAVIKALSSDDMLTSYRSHMDLAHTCASPGSVEYTDNWFFRNDGTHLISYIKELDRLRHEFADD